MKVMLTIVMLSVLVVGGAALQCYKCKKTSVSMSNVACDEKAKKTCPNTTDACVTAKVSYKAAVIGKTEETYHDCGKEAAKDAADSICKVQEDFAKDNPVVSKFKCDTKYCKEDLCNAGNAAQIPLFLLAAAVGLFGLLF
jgi:hypothetical protein